MADKTTIQKLEENKCIAGGISSRYSFEMSKNPTQLQIKEATNREYFADAITIVKEERDRLIKMLKKHIATCEHCKEDMSCRLEAIDRVCREVLG